jgi:hypothetical protein
MVVNVNTMYGFPTETGADAQQTLDYLARLHMPSLLPYHFCLRGYEGCEIVDQAAEAGWDTSVVPCGWYALLSRHAHGNGHISEERDDESRDRISHAVRHA